MDWARILAYVTGTVDQELLGRNEYLAAENRIMKAQLNGRMKLPDAEAGIAFKRLLGHDLLQGPRFTAKVRHLAARRRPCRITRQTTFAGF